ncbi:MAG: hypothetical protein KBB78_04155 [Candidatus Pacebacteria bacterium]|nr:hypothetical protein [Candidatus Paceibacterota bacterium]
MTNKTLQKIILGLLVVLVALAFLTVYRMRVAPSGEPVSEENVPQEQTKEFGGATEEELQAMLDAITPTDGSGGLSEEDMAAALADLRRGEEGTETEPDATPEGELKPLTEAEIQARLQALKEEPADDGVGITPQ